MRRRKIGARRSSNRNDPESVAQFAIWRSLKKQFFLLNYSSKKQQQKNLFLDWHGRFNPEDLTLQPVQ